MANVIGTAPGGWQQLDSGQWMQTGTQPALDSAPTGSVAAAPGATFDQDNATGQFVPIDSALGAARQPSEFNSDQFINEVLGQGFSSSALQDQANKFAATAQADSERRSAEARLRINDQFNAATGRIQKLGESARGGAGAAARQTSGAGLSGLGLSSTLNNELIRISTEVGKEISNLESQRTAALDKLQFEDAERLDKRIASFQEQQDKIFDRRLKVFEFAAKQKESGFNQAKEIYNIVKDIPEGETITLAGQTFTGIKRDSQDPFFTSGNIVDLMQSTPLGQEFQLQDPNTGQIWNITGVDQPKNDLKQFTATDDQGNFRIISYNPLTGTVESVAEAGQVGKTKTAATNITLQMRGETGGALAQAGKTLDASVGPDGNYDTNTYIEERQKFAEITGGDVDTFDKTFSGKLNENEPLAQPYIKSTLLPDEISSEEKLINSWLGIPQEGISK